MAAQKEQNLMRRIFVVSSQEGCTVRMCSFASQSCFVMLSISHLCSTNQAEAAAFCILRDHRCPEALFDFETRFLPAAILRTLDSFGFEALSGLPLPVC